MKIKGVNGSGFLSLGQFQFNIDRPGVTLVEGVNNDSTAISNGAGKSSLFEAILWCLYGVTRRGLTGDDVINRHTKGGCFVQVYFSVKGVEYMATRARKSKLPFENGEDKSSGLYLHRINGGDQAEITKGTIKDTQDLLESIIGMSALSFQKSIYFGQGDVKPMAELSDGDLKNVFEQALGLTDITKDWAMAAAHRKGVEVSLSSLQSKKSGKEIGLITLEQSIATFEQTVANFDEEKAQKIGGIERTIAEINKQTEQLSSDRLMCANNMQLLEKQKGEAGEHFEKLAELKRQFDEKIKEVEIERCTAGARLVSGQSTIASQKARIKEVLEMVGKECEACGQTLSQDGAKTFASRFVAGIKLAESEALGFETTKQGKQKAKDNMEHLLGLFMGKYNAALEKYNAIASELVEVKTQFNVLSSRVDSSRAAAAVQQQTLKSVVESGLDLQTKLAAMKAGFDADKKQIDEIEQEIAGITEQLETAKLLEEALSNAGLKNYVLAGVTPEINKYANEYLGVLDPSMAVDISTVTTLKSGEDREKFSISVETDCGSKGFKGHSGGEKQKVNLAISLAFNTMVRNSSPESVNLLVLDEPFESLDEGSSEQVMELISHISSDNVYLISHNQAVKDLIPNKIKVEKEKGVAKILD